MLKEALLGTALIFGTNQASADDLLSHERAESFQTSLKEQGLSGCELSFRGRLFQLQIRQNVMEVLSNINTPIDETFNNILIQKALDGLCRTPTSKETMHKVSTTKLDDKVLADLEARLGIKVDSATCPKIDGFSWTNANKAAIRKTATAMNTFLEMTGGKIDIHSALNRVCIVRELSRGVHRNANGVHAGDMIVFEAETTDISTIAHEFFHHTDLRDGRGDEVGWRGINARHKLKYGSDAENYDNCLGKSSGTPKGFARDYGYECGILEDKATIAEDLFSPYSARSLIARSVHDAGLREKIEMITGCVLKGTTFVATMTSEEYQQRFGTGVQYYLKWSHRKMDHTYWNRIVRGQ